MNAEFRMWIGVDPETGKPLPWSLSKTRTDCRSAMDAMCWGAGRTRRVTLKIDWGKGRRVMENGR